MEPRTITFDEQRLSAATGAATADAKSGITPIWANMMLNPT